jgi:hypothetical protein
MDAAQARAAVRRRRRARGLDPDGAPVIDPVSGHALNGYSDDDVSVDSDGEPEQEEEKQVCVRARVRQGFTWGQSSFRFPPERASRILQAAPEISGNSAPKGDFSEQKVQKSTSFTLSPPKNASTRRVCVRVCVFACVCAEWVQQ